MPGAKFAAATALGAFLKFLTSTDAVSAIKAKGMEPG